MFRDGLINKAVMLGFLLIWSGNGRAEGTDVDQPAPPITAAWHLQHIEFNFRSTNIYYSCEGFRQKVVMIMKAIGARDDVNMDLRCRSGTLLNTAATIITVATPVEASPANVAALTTYSTETQLAARLNNVQLPTASDIERFSAEWRKVDFNRSRRTKLDAGDCDLLDGLIEQVFPRLPVQVLKRRVSCSHGSANRMSLPLQVAALMAAPVIPMAYAPTK
jgi:hypothetical protein